MVSSPFDLVFGKPQRAHQKVDSEHYLVSVTPPEKLGLPTRHVKLTIDQFSRYISWLSEGDLIQQILSELSATELEILKTGIMLP